MTQETQSSRILTQTEQRDLQAAIAIVSKILQDKVIEGRERFEPLFANYLTRGLIGSHVAALSVSIKERAHCGQASMEYISQRLERALLINFMSGIVWAGEPDVFDKMAGRWGFASGGEATGTEDGLVQDPDTPKVDDDLPAS